MNNRIQIARDFANSINSKYIKRIILFGSVARGEDNEDSDIDILIVSDFGDIIEPLIADEVFKIVLDKEEFISAHVMPESKLNRLKSFTFLNNIEREGIILG
ncbi:MAG: nucleotidyltransferase domain-containing protein [Methanosphaera sp.]|nr:nucleotidyltransferase domain-containing protein [Methanosphaera sp.]